MSKDLHQNSTASYREEREAGRSDFWRRKIFELLAFSINPLTDRQIMHGLGDPDFNNVRPEITRLKQDGLVEEFDKVRCNETGKTVRRCKATTHNYLTREEIRKLRMEKKS